MAEDNSDRRLSRAERKIEREKKREIERFWSHDGLKVDWVVSTVTPHGDRIAPHMHLRIKIGRSVFSLPEADAEDLATIIRGTSRAIKFDVKVPPRD
jgi:hypothetical protein